MAKLPKLLRKQQQGLKQGRRRLMASRRPALCSQPARAAVKHQQGLNVHRTLHGNLVGAVDFLWKRRQNHRSSCETSGVIVLFSRGLWETMAWLKKVCAVHGCLAVNYD